MELVYPPVVALAKTMFRVLDNKIEIEGAEHIPTSGGAVLASNHASYLDFIYCGLGAQPAKRLVRFMAKKAVFDHKISGPLMRGMRHIPVDRSAGTTAFRAAIEALKSGEVVGVFPEATISESFTVKELKSGAARMARSAKVLLIPMAVWGPHRLWTKGRKKELTKRHVPVLIKIGEPIEMITGTCRFVRSRLCPLVQSRCGPHTTIGINGTFAVRARRAAPDFSSLTVNDSLIVASGKTPTISPSFSAWAAVRNEAAPASRSTGMCRMPRISGPLILWSKTAFLAMKRTSRLAGWVPSPQKMKSR